MKRIIFTLCVLFLVFSVGNMWADQGSSDKPKNATLPVILNILPGLGLGSFIQGDVGGGFIGLGGEVVGAGLAGYGLTYAIAAGIGTVIANMFGSSNGSMSQEMVTVGWCMVGGLAVYAGTKIFEIIRPISFARKYNENRGLEANVMFILEPASTSSDIAVEPGLALRLSY
jgi:hypothetical protein